MELYMEHVSKQFKDLTAVDDISQIGRAHV